VSSIRDVLRHVCKKNAETQLNHRHLIFDPVLFRSLPPAQGPKVNPITTGLLYKISSAFAYAYKGIWADNADRMSLLYSGTGALKTDYTRTGKRSVRACASEWRGLIVVVIMFVIVCVWGGCSVVFV
jgi:hypothetical protein